MTTKDAHSVEARLLSRILIYGVTGYTGKLIAKAAADQGARPILAGRNLAKVNREFIPSWMGDEPARRPSTSKAKQGQGIANRCLTILSGIRVGSIDVQLDPQTGSPPDREGSPPKLTPVLFYDLPT